MEPEKAPAKLRVAGIWCGALEEVPLESWTLDALREEISRRCKGRHPPECINLIKENLLRLGLKNNSKILASAAASEEERNEVEEEEARVADEPTFEAERLEWLYRTRGAAERLSRRGAYDSLENYHIELKNQTGEKVILGTKTDERRAVLFGIMLHANGKQILESKSYRDALDVLLMAEQVYSLCNPKVIQVNPSFWNVFGKSFTSWASPGFHLQHRKYIGSIDSTNFATIYQPMSSLPYFISMEGSSHMDISFGSKRLDK
ncbi:unnamed protein product [Spirodela intermedia]|uniref:Uncharacterized protein n=1 Tax=Spirodela intermedia TaxID=51605 RepID=A0A7I8JJZ2_SPIIN|nr:unnamed protein product [Spirodela intermedia]CAA6670449.1 unnamed protein product [Spirodela intermedia]